MLGRERFLYTFMLLLYVIAGMSRVLASRSSYATSMEICSTFNTQLLETAILPIPQTPVFLVEDPINLEQLTPRMAGSKEDCELGAQVILSAVTKNDLIFRIFKLLLTHPLFRISFDLPTFGSIAGQAKSTLDTFVIYINPNQRNAETVIRHELTHMFLSFIQDSQFNAEIFPISADETDIAKIFINAGLNITPNELQEAWKNKTKQLLQCYRKTITDIKLTPEEQTLLNAVKTAIENDETRENMLFIKTEADLASTLEVGRQYPFNEITSLNSLAKNSDYFTVRNIDPLENNTVGLYLEMNNPLLLFVIQQFKSLSVMKYYDATDRYEECITFTFETASLKPLRALHPDIIAMLEYYADKLEKTYTPQEFSTPPLVSNYMHQNLYAVKPLPLDSQHDLDIVYLNIFNIINKQKTATNRELDVALFHLTRLIKKQDADANNTDKALHRVLFGEILYLRGNMKLAAIEFKKAYTLDKTAFTQVEHSLEHFDEAVKNGQTVANQSYRRFHRS